MKSLLALVFVSSIASASDLGFDPSALSSLTNAAASDLLEVSAYGADHRPYASARALGVSLGLDLGVDVTVISVPQSFKDAMKLIGSTDIPTSIPLPRINVRKGLPWGVDFGFTWVGYGVYSVLGFDLQKNWIRQPVALASRISYGKQSLNFIHSSTFSMDALASIGFLLFEPYLGLGAQFGSGDLRFNSGNVPVSVQTQKSFSSMRFFAGLPISLLVLKVTFEYSTTFSGLSTYGAKAAFSL
jgi:hypothetical protein